MPQHILNPSLYADRTVQDWHRDTFPSHFWAIDLDLMGACKRCREPVYLIEATTNPSKPTSILRALAARAKVAAFVVEHDTERITRGKCIWPEFVRYGDEVQIRAALEVLRIIHDHEAHGVIPGGA